MMAFEQFADSWNRFFFEPIPATQLAVFRILFGGLLTLNSLLMFRTWRTFLAPGGIFPPPSNGETSSRLNLFRWLPDTAAVVACVLVLHGLACVALTIGCCTRLSALVAFVTLVSIHHRNPTILHSGDGVLRIMTFLLIFSPSGSTLSVDSIISSAGEGVPLVSPWSLRLMQIQVAMIYLRSVYWKLRGPLWRNGTATFFATQVESYRRFQLPNFVRKPAMYAIATWMTLIVESALGTLIWVGDIKHAVILTGILLHLSIEAFLNVQLFGWTMMVCLLLFV